MALSASVTIHGILGSVPTFEVVTRVELHAALHQLFEVVVEVHHADPAFDLDLLVGQSAFLDFPDEPFWKKIDGVVREVRQLTSESSFMSVYEIVVVPPHWLLTRRRDCRIFQDRTSVEIAGDVFDGYKGRVAGEPHAGVGRPLPRREYCVQFEETDHDFVLRVLAEDGLTLFFDHHASGDPAAPRSSEPDDLRIVDDTTQGQALATVRYNPPSGLSTAASQAAGRTSPEVYHVTTTARVETTRVTLGDYNYETPAVVLREQAQATAGFFDGEGDLESYGHEVGRYADGAPGRAAATRDLEAARAEHHVYRCKSSFRLPPGSRFTLDGSPWGDLNLVVIRCDATGTFRQSTSTAHVDNDLVCIPAASPFRPRRRPRPRIYGTQTAFVVGKQVGQDEIDVDASGRVKVHFNWDRRKTSFEGKPTRHIRVSQPWAGQGYGMTLVPRVGDELVVAFLDGDPDEPIVVGRVHNPVYPDPLNFKDPDQHTVSIWKSRSSPGERGGGDDRYNMVMMQDKSDDELLKLRAQRDFEHDTLHDARITVGGSQSTGAGSISMSSGSTISESAKTAFTMDAGDSMSLHAGPGGLSETSNTTIGLTAGTTMGLGSGTTMTLTAGTRLELNGPTVTILGTAICSVHGGTLYLHGKGATYVSSDGPVTISAGGPVTVTGSEIDLNC